LEAEIANIQAEVSKLESKLAKVRPLIMDGNGRRLTKLQANKNHVQDLQTAHDEYTANLSEQAARLKLAEEKVKEFEARSDTLSARLSKAEKSLQEKEAARQTTQSELDDLLMVFGDVEEKAEKYKQRLKDLGENVSDGEDGDDDEDEGDASGVD
jgi:chromosome segregation ATPase